MAGKEDVNLSLGGFSVNDSVWIAAAVLSYEKYFKDSCRVIGDFAFSIKDIQARAQQFANGNVQYPRVHQWCCADQSGHYKSYLRVINGDKRRLTFPGEVSDKPTEPENLDKSLLVHTELGEISLKELFDFVHTEY